MKTSFILMFAVLIHVMAIPINGQDVFEIRMTNATIRDVLKTVESKTNYRFFFSDDFADIYKKVTVDAETGNIVELLSKLFENSTITYKILENNMVVITPTGSVRQGITITGTITDAVGEPMPGVNIQVKGTVTGSVTDINGRYTINVPGNESVLMFSFIGYKPQEYAVGNQRQINVRMEEDNREIEEVVVVGYGTVRKSDLTGSVASVSSEKVTQVNAVSNIAQALQGQAPGVQANQRSGQPGEAVMIKIRGTNSIAGGNEPLYVVDGLLLDGLSAQLNPDDIQNIEILKDASATAIYGSRGANGVVMITTKRGKEGKASVSYNGYFGVQQLRKKIDLINASEFAQLQNEVAVNDGAALPWTQTQIDALGEGTDWQDEVYRTGKVQNHDISVSGGGPNTKYYTSFGYFNQDGIIRNSGFERMSFRANFDQKIAQGITLNTSLYLQNSEYNKAVYQSADGGGGIPFTTMVMPPTQGIYDANGNYTRFTGVSWGATNPVGISRELYNPSNDLRFMGNAGVNWEIVDGLMLNVSIGIDHNTNKEDYYAPSVLTIGQPGGTAYKNYSSKNAFLNENTLSYTKKFNTVHTLNALAGITYQANKADELRSGTAKTFISDVYQDNNLNAASTKGQPGSSYNDSKLISYLGRINYNYDDRYLVTFTGRYDGSSKFGENNKYAFFPSGALAWRVSQESFMQHVEAVSNLKIRVSYGTSGNQAISSYQTLSRIENRNLIFGGQNNTGFYQSAMDNVDLKWETTRQFDIGFDLGLFNNRIQVVADYYAKKTTDLLLEVTLPPSSGYGTVLRNVGSVQNRGWEFQLITANLTGPFTWSSVLTISHNKTKILDLGSDAQGNAITYKEVGSGGNWFPMQVGQSMSQLYGYEVDGIYQSDKEAADNGENTKKAGDYRFRETDGVAGINSDDRVTLTHLEPKFTFGFNNFFSYKGFDLSILLVGSYGNDVVNEFRKYNLTMNGLWTPTREAYENRWRGAGSSNSVDKPSKNSGSSMRDYANSLWVEDGSYLRVRDITLGYTFPSKLFGFIPSLRVYVSAQNWITWTSYSGYDPEASWSSTQINGWDRGVYPSTKSITGGVKITF